ncbi:MAG: hypothetical protein DLM67_01555 [Candidatus Nephthysia bennettiae]|uniref:Uncharacterized protein n=1 Tax=Candidatus Nephthysia bennettiae TaxID=3127016 RepID=A0A934KAR0_9BACT|nr:hypothetical protein [Candidatus Dormibacteraeota bacterium]MBJ7612140.1 hypothetical protein [Candidatus Dormibacteraeota bacterium]PZS00331.1 MAG: hypothetical protein DLM67_01555 [Candidatus Dormibacteraeota bacterium]
MATGNTGLLIIRAYSEAGSSSPLRAQIRLTRDVSAGIELTLNLADTEGVVQAVRTWLDGVLEVLPVVSASAPVFPRASSAAPCVTPR